MKIKADVETNFLLISSIAMLCACSMVVAIIFTFKLIKIIGREAPEGCVKMFIKQTAGAVGKDFATETKSSKKDKAASMKDWDACVTVVITSCPSILYCLESFYHYCACCMMSNLS